MRTKLICTTVHFMKTMQEGAAAALHPDATLVATTAVPSAIPHSAHNCLSAALGLDALGVRTPAVVAGLVPARDGREHSTLLRLLEIGFVPGETVQILARGAWGGDPLAVRVGQATFALRQQEAAMVQVQVMA
jgi:ferrous iron transport protein A